MLRMKAIILSSLLTPLLAFTPISPHVNVAQHIPLVARSKSSSGIRNSALEAYKHTLAILTLPTKSTDRIANEAILATCMHHTSDKLSIVLRCQDGITPQLNDLRGYVGEIYSLAWDVVLDIKQQTGELLNVIIYPQNLPNTAAEAWITHRQDLECICSHDSIIGWVSTEAMGSGREFDHVKGSGLGGLDQFVDAVNGDRKSRGLNEVKSLEVEDWPKAIWTDGNVVFLEDVEEAVSASDDKVAADNGGLIGGYRILSSSLYNSVAVGGTFDGMHYGHRKLLTLAVSSVLPNTGRLTIGITTDEMLLQKEFAELIPKLDERIKGVRDFVDTLAPGMKNRVKIVPILDKFGPPGSAYGSDTYTEKNDYDALVLSHETLETGRMLNQHRVEELGMKPLKLLCTRRTEAYGMSSTNLRRMKKQIEIMDTCVIDDELESS